MRDTAHISRLVVAKGFSETCRPNRTGSVHFPLTPFTKRYRNRTPRTGMLSFPQPRRPVQHHHDLRLLVLLAAFQHQEPFPIPRGRHGGADRIVSPGELE